MSGLGQATSDKLLQELIDDAARRFGPRSRATWRILPVRVERRGYPETIFDAQTQAISVRVTERVLTSAEEARYELGHEAVHCLLASGRRDTIYFEEGLANYNALHLPGLPRAFRRGSERILPAVLSHALWAFEALNPSDEKIAALRAEVPEIDLLGVPSVQKHFDVSEKIAQAACLRMPKDRPEWM